MYSHFTHHDRASINSGWLFSAVSSARYISVGIWPSSIRLPKSKIRQVKSELLPVRYVSDTCQSFAGKQRLRLRQLKSEVLNSLLLVRPYVINTVAGSIVTVNQNQQ